MIIRIVKMEFSPEKVDTFLEIFHRSAPLIRSCDGCQKLELYRDASRPNIIFTYSYWYTVEDLDNYRNSNLFKTTWADTKVLFQGKPQAWTVDRIWAG